MTKEFNINEVFLKAHKAAIRKANEDSERSGVPLVVYQNGKVISIPPKFKYVRVPIEPTTEKPRKKPAV